jgi:predicted oxidoreductase
MSIQKVNLSANGPVFSRVVFGVMKWGVWGHRLNTGQMQSLIEQSVDYGVTTFDHADIYGHYTTEADFGKALQQSPGLRKKIQIVTKCGIKLVTPNRPAHKIKSYDTSKEYILYSAEQSLKQLHTDYIDLFLIHRPSPLMQPDEIAEAFHALKSEGKVKYFGVSNFTPAQFDMLNSRFSLTTNQIEASLMHAPPFLDGTLDQCLKHNIRPMAWSPLGGGAIFTSPDDPQVQRILPVLEQILERRSDGVRPDQLLLAWLMKHPSGILPVVGTAKIERLKAAADATAVEMSREEWFELWEAAQGQEVP